VPRLRDLLKEYAVAGEGRVRVEFIDPAEDRNWNKRQAKIRYQARTVSVRQ
jgi:ABC-2 type transport system permease protein